MMCIFLFLVTNIAVMLLFGVIMIFFNVQFSNLMTLLIISGMIGFTGSILSLLMSKHIALFSVNGRILKNTTSEIEKWLLDIIRNQSHSLGIIPPLVVVYDACDMNAFATGARKDSALVAVSTGLLQGMNHDEIEAVIAHEMSHISNGDMVTITLLQGVLNTFVIFISRVLSQFIYYCMSCLSSENDSENDNRINTFYLESNSFIYCFISMVLESIFGILASMVVLWFSRCREFYADAGSARLVGCDKMIAALEKLKLSYEPKESNVIFSFCINGYKRSSNLSKLFMSHPSLDSRIKALRCGRYLNNSSLL